MDESDFEGTTVLEKLAEIGKVDEFFSAVDEDNFSLAQKLMKMARIDAPTQQRVLEKMQNSENDA